MIAFEISYAYLCLCAMETVGLISTWYGPSTTQGKNILSFIKLMIFRSYFTLHHGLVPLFRIAKWQNIQLQQVSQCISTNYIPNIRKRIPTVKYDDFHVAHISHEIPYSFIKVIATLFDSDLT